jgi:hypothetical protein
MFWLAGNETRSSNPCHGHHTYRPTVGPKQSDVQNGKPRQDLGLYSLLGVSKVRTASIIRAISQKTDVNTRHRDKLKSRREKLTRAAEPFGTGPTSRQKQTYSLQVGNGRLNSKRSHLRDMSVQVNTCALLFSQR